MNSLSKIIFAERFKRLKNISYNCPFNPLQQKNLVKTATTYYLSSPDYWSTWENSRWRNNGLVLYHVSLSVSRLLTTRLISAGRGCGACYKTELGTLLKKAKLGSRSCTCIRKNSRFFNQHCLISPHMTKLYNSWMTLHPTVSLQSFFYIRKNSFNSFFSVWIESGSKTFMVRQFRLRRKNKKLRQICPKFSLPFNYRWFKT
jgi:hypothetical protein